MKLKAIDPSSKKPLANVKIQLQMKGKDRSGFLSLTTDQNGEFKLDDKFKGQQINATVNGMQTPWITAEDGVVVKIEARKMASLQEKSE